MFCWVFSVLFVGLVCGGFLGVLFVCGGFCCWGVGGFLEFFLLCLFLNDVE